MRLLFAFILFPFILLAQNKNTGLPHYSEQPNNTPTEQFGAEVAWDYLNRILYTWNRTTSQWDAYESGSANSVYSISSLTDTSSITSPIEGDLFLQDSTVLGTYDGTQWQIFQGGSGVQGPPGPQGDVGPQGIQGDDGAGITLLGTVATVGDLPPAGNTVGDLYIVSANGNGYAWDGTAWNDVGPIRGPAGTNGNDGAQGPQGIQGPAGDTGPTGPAGTDGNDGVQGPPGIQGPVGDIGPIGPAGADGNDGAQGPQGIQGPAGDTGPAGADGADGNDGAQGPQGIQGPAGDTGPAGADGNDGAQGPQGIQGPVGPKDTLVSVLPSYDSLRNSLGSELTDIVLVQDFSYTFNNDSYTTKGGLFYKDSTATENGGTVITAADGTDWTRSWDGVNIRYDWWQTGGYNRSGNLTDDVNTDGFTGVFDDGDRVEEAVEIGGEGAVIHLGGPGDTLIFDNFISLKYGQSLIGYKCVVKRKPQSSLISFTSDGSNDIVVNDASGIIAGQGINLMNPDSSKFLFTRVTEKSGNTLTLNNPVPTNTGFLLFCHRLINANNDIGGSNYIADIIFEGSYNPDAFVANWELDNWTIVGPVNTQIGYPGLHIDRCEFYNIPQENIYTGVGIVEYCKADSLHGSFIHFNANNSGEGGTVQENKREYLMTIRENVVRNVCLDDNGHNEGVLTFSNWSTGVRVYNNKFTNGEQGVLGFYTSDDTHLLFQNNICADFKKRIIQVNSGSANITLKILDNRFYSCGDIDFNNHAPSNPAEEVIIERNKIYNGRLRLQGIENLSLKNNTIAYVSNLGIFKGFDSSYGNISWPDPGFASMVYIRGIENANITDNTIVGDSITHDNAYINGILYHRPNESAPISNGVINDQRLNISNNTIIGFRRGINLWQYSDQINFGNTAFAPFWRVSNNDVVMVQGLSNTQVTNFSIAGYPGTQIQNNNIWMNLDSTSTNTYGIIAHGVHSSVTTTDKLGVVVQRNNVYGGINASDNASILVGWSNGVWNAHNSLVEDNLLFLPFRNESNGNSTFLNNRMLSDLLPGFTSPPAPQWRFGYELEEL